MFFLLRALPGLATLWFAAADLLAILHPAAFWLYAPLGLLGPAIALWVLTRRADVAHGFWGLMFFPVYSLAFGVGVLLFSEHRTLQLAIIAGVALLIGFQLEQAFRFRFQTARYQPNALVNASIAYALIGPFFAALTLFDLQLFANFSLWLVLVLHLPLTAMWYVALQSLFTAERHIHFRWGIVTVLVLVETFAVLAWLPAVPTVKAAMYAVVATFVVLRYRNDVEHASTQRWPFVLLTCVLLLLVVLAHWFA